MKKQTQMNNKPKRYRLLKDLPDCEAGVVFTRNYTKENYISFENLHQQKGAIVYDKEYVENNPEWFKEIHICKHCGAETSQPDSQCYKAPTAQEIKEPEEFVWTDKLVSEAIYWVCRGLIKPERADNEVKRFRFIKTPSSDAAYDGKKFVWTLQDEFGPMGSIKFPRKYTQEELDKAIVDAYHAGRVGMCQNADTFLKVYKVGNEKKSV